MNAYKRHGFSWSDCLDYRTWGDGRRQLGLEGRLAGNQFYIDHAAALRREDDPDAAKHYIAKAREYRLELRGR